MPHNSELPTPVVEDLFNADLADPPNDIIEMALSYLTEQIESFGFAVNESWSQGVITTIRYSHGDKVKGAIVINRLERDFSIEAQVAESCGGGMFLPVTGSWADIRTYLANLQRVTQQR